MLTQHRKLRLKTVDNQLIDVEINYSNSPKVKDCKIVKFAIGDKDYEIERQELLSLMLIIGDSETQGKMLPIKLQKIRKYETELELKFTCKKDYRKGEDITVRAPYIAEIPDEEEMFAGNVKSLGHAPIIKKH